jgi:RNA-binding protein
MLTSKERAALRAQANGIDTILLIGKGGVTDTVISQADSALTARELIKGGVLENSMLTAREACDALCEALGADGVQVVGNKFVLYRKSEKQVQNKPKAKKVNPVRKGVQTRRRKAQAERQKRDAYFKQAAIEAAIEKSRQQKARREQRGQ